MKQLAKKLVPKYCSVIELTGAINALVIILIFAVDLELSDPFTDIKKCQM